MFKETYDYERKRWRGGGREERRTGGRGWGGRDMINIVQTNS